MRRRRAPSVILRHAADDEHRHIAILCAPFLALQTHQVAGSHLSGRTGKLIDVGTVLRSDLQPVRSVRRAALDRRAMVKAKKTPTPTAATTATPPTMIRSGSVFKVSARDGAVSSASPRQIAEISARRNSVRFKVDSSSKREVAHHTGVFQQGATNNKAKYLPATNCEIKYITATRKDAAQWNEIHTRHDPGHPPLARFS